MYSSIKAGARDIGMGGIDAYILHAGYCYPLVHGNEKDTGNCS